MRTGTHVVVVGLMLSLAIGCGDDDGDGAPIDARPMNSPDAASPDASQPPPDASSAAADAAAPDGGAPDATPGVPSEPAIVSFTDPQIDTFADDVVGFRFTVGSEAITVTDLGIFDFEQDGLGEGHPVGIFDATSQELVVSADIPAGTAATLEGDFRFVPVTPVELAADTTYVVLSYRATGVDGIAYFVMSFTVSPFITYDGDVATNKAGGLIFTDEAFGIPNAWFGPNFKARL